MKTKRRTLIVLLVFVLAAGAALALLTHANQKAEQAASEAEDGSIPLLDGTTATLESVSIQYGGDTLTLQPSDDGWTLTEDPAYHLDDSACSTIRTALAGMKAKRQLEAQPGEDYGFDAPRLVVNVSAAGESTTLTVGAENPVTGDVYVRREGGDAVYTVDAARFRCMEQTKAELFGAFSPAGITVSDIEAVRYTLQSGETIKLQSVSQPTEADSTTYQTVWQLTDEPDAALDTDKTDALLAALASYVTGQDTAADLSACGFDAPLVECTSVPDLKERLKEYDCYITPHHMGYMTGFRGYNWAAFSQDRQTPFVEMFSRHGLAESDTGDYDYLHDMGPRIWEGSIQYGLEQGHKFGLMCSTDQHAGYPGSYGDGRIGVLAPSLTRDAIWEALRTRHVCAATGDKILIDFRLNDAFMGDVVRSNSRRIYLNVTGESCIDYVDVVKNGQILARMNGPLTPVAPEGDTVRCKVKVDFGWNREERYVHWQGKLSVNKGRIVSVTPCFRGAAFTSPQEGETEFKTHVNRILSVGEKETELDLYSSKNPNTTTAAMQAVILDLEMPKDGVLTADFNGKKFEHTLGELLEGSRSHFMIGWLSEAILFNLSLIHI